MVFINEKSFREVVTDSFLITFRLSWCSGSTMYKVATDDGITATTTAALGGTAREAAQRKREKNENNDFETRKCCSLTCTRPLACHLINDIVECGSKFSRRRQREREKEKNCKKESDTFTFLVFMVKMGNAKEAKMRINFQTSIPVVFASLNIDWISANGILYRLSSLLFSGGSLSVPHKHTQKKLNPARLDSEECMRKKWVSECM